MGTNDRMWYNKFTIDQLHMRGEAHLFSLWDISHGGEVLLMDMGTALTLMISFGMLVAFIMSDKNNK